MNIANSPYFRPTFGPEFQTSSFEQAVDEINDIEPDVLVASGDLTENGLVSQYRDAKRALDRLENSIAALIAPLLHLL